MKRVIYVLIALIIITNLYGCSDNSKVESLSLSPSSMDILTTDTSELNVLVQPDGLEDISLTWQSSNSEVVSVSGDSKVKSGNATANVSPVASGSAEITVTSKNGCSATCSVSVREPVEATVIYLFPSDAAMIVGNSQGFHATVLPQNVDDNTLIWSSSNVNVASVNDKGLVTAKAAGTATITATTSNGISDSSDVNIRELIKAEKISFPDSKISMLVKESRKLNAVIEPADADAASLTWNSSDPAVIAVNNGFVTAKGVGTATISVVSENSTLAECTVTVYAEMNTELLDKLLQEQPLYVSSTSYIVQSTAYKALYPDMLNAIVKNQGEDTIRNVVVAFMAWDDNNLPVKIVPQYAFDGGAYVQQANYPDVNMIPGASYGENSGLSLHAGEQKSIGSFKACVVSYETWDGKTWKNPYYDDFLDLYYPESERQKNVKELQDKLNDYLNGY